MTVTKRLRFEVLRRDDHTCRYCGGKAPDVALTVDHVTPVALGGSDEPSNLVAACRDCNAGKSATPPDADRVAEVSADALRHADLIRQAYAVLVEQIGKRDEYVDAFARVWGDHPAGPGWRSSLIRWHDHGVPIEIITDSARIAIDNPAIRTWEATWKYFCGIVWKRVQLVSESVADKAALDGAWMTGDAREEYGLDQWLSGFDSGAAEGWVRHSGPAAVLEDWVDGFKRAPRAGVWGRLEKAGVRDAS